jgi:hypothetical protein
MEAQDFPYLSHWQSLFRQNVLLDFRKTSARDYQRCYSLQPNFTDSIPCGPRFHRMWAAVPWDVGRDSSENQNADRFTTESWTASGGISGPLRPEYAAYTLKGTILPPTNKYSNCRTNRAAAVNALFHSEFTVSAADGLYKRTGLNASYRFSELFELLTSHGEDWPCAAMALILEYKRRTALINDTSLLWHLSHWNLGTMKLS